MAHSKVDTIPIEILNCRKLCIENLLFAKFYKMAPEMYQKYRSTDIEDQVFKIHLSRTRDIDDFVNIEPPNHIEPNSISNQH